MSTPLKWPASIIELSETQDVIRRRRFQVRSADDVKWVLDKLRAERFMGKVEIGLGPGSTPSYLQAEERGKV